MVCSILNGGGFWVFEYFLFKWGKSFYIHLILILIVKNLKKWKLNEKLKTPPSIQYTTDHWLSNDTNVTDSRKIFALYSSRVKLKILTLIYYDLLLYIMAFINIYWKLIFEEYRAKIFQLSVTLVSFDSQWSVVYWMEGGFWVFEFFKRFFIFSLIIIIKMILLYS